MKDDSLEHYATWQDDREISKTDNVKVFLTELWVLHNKCHDCKHLQNLISHVISSRNPSALSWNITSFEASTFDIFMF